MSALSFSPVALRPPELSSTHRSYAVSFPRRRPLSVSFASVSPETSTAPPQKPEIQLEFLGPKPGDAVNRTTAVSGEKLLRNIMQDKQIELYAAYGKVMNCGGPEAVELVLWRNRSLGGWLAKLLLEIKTTLERWLCKGCPNGEND
ncbi:UNVERIFIED_CONTAM: hypothetical protein Sangu_1835800 [Sesamum angustifolium]|uniref:Uncharacterized protein n=1 Tax=Sesamum angustifolium TaxID=2727405 RepID=A0AAW2MAW7_9LAMI